MSNHDDSINKEEDTAIDQESSVDVASIDITSGSEAECAEAATNEKVVVDTDTNESGASGAIPKNYHEVEREEEAKLRGKYPGIKGPGSSAFLQKRLSKGTKYFDSGDYNMAKAKVGSGGACGSVFRRPLPPGMDGRPSGQSAGANGQAARANGAAGHILRANGQASGASGQASKANGQAPNDGSQASGGQDNDESGQLTGVSEIVPQSEEISEEVDSAENDND